MLVMGMVALFAESTPIKDGNKTVGTLNWNYSIKTFETRAGSFTTISATNNSEEFVTASFKTDAGGFETIHIPPYESREVIIGTNEAASRAYCMDARVE